MSAKRCFRRSLPNLRWFVSTPACASRHYSAQINKDFCCALILLPGLLLGNLVNAQSFGNLGFESAVLVPVSGDPYDRVEAGPAFPLWTCYTDSTELGVTNVLTLVNYDNEFLDSAGVAILNTNDVHGFQALSQAFEGNYTALLQAGFSLTNEAIRLSAAIAQTGVVPAYARTINFEAAAYNLNFAVTFAGQNLPVYALSSTTNYIVFGADISSFAGQTNELRFTVFPCLTFGQPAINNLYLDNIQFSPPPPQAAPFIFGQPGSQTANAGSNASFTVTVTAYPAAAYQWYFII